jgi:hypothetical protein
MNMLMLVTSVLFLSFVICALIMLFVIYWRIFVLLKDVSNRMRYE